MTTTTELVELLRARYIKPAKARGYAGGIFLTECGLNGSNGRRVDALYVGFTSASGRLLVGHEIKATRSDWLRELAKAGKADTWADQCHAWWVVAPSTDVVHVDELPPAWGLFTVGPRGLKITKPATVNPDMTPSWTVVRSIMARQDTLRVQAIQEQVAAHLEKLRRDYNDRLDEARAHTTLTPKQRSRLEALDHLEQRLGRTIASWATENDDITPETAAAAIRIVTASSSILGRPYRLPNVDQLLDLADRIRDGADALTEATDQLKEVADRG